MTYYDDISQGYDELHGEEQLEKLKNISKHINIKKTYKLLDVGCGSGISTRYFKCLCTGIDPSIKLLEIAKQNDSGGKYLQGNAEKLPFENQSFDVVISLTAIQNFDDIKKGLQEIKRVGKEKFVLTYIKGTSKSKQIDMYIKNIFGKTLRIEQKKDIIHIIPVLSQTS